MARFLLHVREAVEGDLPPVCVKCGRRARQLVTWRLQVVRAGFMCIIKRYLDVKMPVCPDHRSNWGWGAVRAKEISERGIVVNNVHDRFVDAVLDWREALEDDDYQRKLDGYRAPRRRDDEDRDDDDRYEEEDRPRRRRRLPETPKRADNTALIVVLIILGVLLVPLVCGGGLLFILMLGWRR